MSVKNTEDMRALIDAAQELMDWCVIPNIDLFYESEQAGQTLCINADCMEAMSLIPDGSVDMVLCDLPYGTTACKWDSVIPFEPLWAHYKRVIKRNGAIVLTASQPFTSALVNSNLQAYRHCWVWDKHIPRGFQNAKYQPMNKHEDVIVFGFQAIAYKPQMTIRDKPVSAKNYSKKSKDTVHNVAKNNDESKVYTYTHRNPDTIISGLWEANAGKVHPTQKPVALMEYLIRTYTNEGETVLDNCMGSGTTGVACVNTGRRFIGIERDPGHYKMARQRVGVAANNADLF